MHLFDDRTRRQERASPRVAAAVLLAAVLLALPGRARAQVAAYYLTCDPDSFAAIYAQPAEDRYVPATLTHEGRTWTDVALRIRGDGSRAYPKKSLKVRFDGEPFEDGRDRLNFNADYRDPSYLHTVVTSHVFRASGHPAFAAEHARLYLNGRFLGLYVRVENMDEAFLAARGLDPGGNLYKATLDDASMSRFDDVDHHWEKKTGADAGRDDLEALIQELETVPDAGYYDFARRVFDYPRMVNILAVNMLVANGSTYYHNYYLFHDTAGGGRWTMLPWDLDLTLSAYGPGYPYHRSSGLRNPDNPFLERALLTPRIFADVRARIDELRRTVFHPDHLDPLVDSLEAVLAPWVGRDTTDAVPDTAEWRRRLQREKDFVRQRPAALDGQFDRSPRPFRVARRPRFGADEVTFRWTPSTDPDGGDVTYTLRVSTAYDFPDGPETSVYPGLVDTLHSTAWPPDGTYYWAVTATDGRAEIDGFDTKNVFVVASRDTLPLVINEVNYHAADDLDTEDWIELYNPHGRAVDVAGWVVRDALDAHTFRFPAAARIEAGGYLVLCRDREAFSRIHPGVAPVHGDFAFGLSGGGEQVRLYDARGVLVDSVRYDDAPPWPPEADGDGYTLELLDAGYDNGRPESWVRSLARGGTPGRRNSAAVIGTVIEVPAVFALEQNHPNPFNPATRIAYRLGRPGRATLVVYGADGRRVATLVDEARPAGRHVVDWRPEGLAAGVYFYVLRVDGRPRHRRAAVLLR